MGDVVLLNKKQEGISKYLDSGMRASGLIKGVDFEVVSIVVNDNNLQSYSLGGFLGTTSNDLFRDTYRGFIQQADILLKEHEITGVSATPFPTIDNVAFYKVKGEIDIDLATEIGLGVVRYKDEHMLYYPFLSADPKSVVYEMLLLKVYFQLLYPKDVDIKLNSGFKLYVGIIRKMMEANGKKHINHLRQIFANHK